MSVAAVSRRVSNILLHKHVTEQASFSGHCTIAIYWKFYVVSSWRGTWPKSGAILLILFLAWKSAHENFPFVLFWNVCWLIWGCVLTRFIMKSPNQKSLAVWLECKRTAKFVSSLDVVLLVNCLSSLSQECLEKVPLNLYISWPLLNVIAWAVRYTNPKSFRGCCGRLSTHFIDFPPWGIMKFNNFVVRVPKCL